MISTSARSASTPGRSWKDLCAAAAARLGRPAEARWIAEESSGYAWADLATGDFVASAEARARFEDMVERRLAGEPLQYVLGSWSFRSLDLMVDRRVLVPRPETEQVVEAALEALDALDYPADDLVAVDLGTGSGAIALSIAAERPKVAVWGADAYQDALDVARVNLAGLGGFAATRVRLVHGYWWSALPAELHGAVDLVVSNPPYVSAAEMEQLSPEVSRWEPRHALESGPGGLECVSEILAGAGPGGWLRVGGAAVIEIAPHQAAEACEMARHAYFSDVHVRKDLAGRDRVLVARGARGSRGARATRKARLRTES